MKKLVLSLAFLAFTITGCTSSDDDTTPVTPLPTAGSGEITGDLTASKTFIKGIYTIKGLAKVKTGVTITFDAGSTITAGKADGLDVLLVEKGGKLIINGTAAEPVVFTADVKESGSWGGIVIYGDAPIVPSASGTTAVSEDGTTTTYGGSNATDNSGSLKYVRVEYAGAKIADGTKELNGFSFYAVGSGTTLENLVSYKGNDDGYEFYGGTVSASNLISYGNADDSFDWQDGWKGQNNSNWYAYQVGTGNFGMEIEAKGVNNAFFPNVIGITLRRAAGTVTEGGSSALEYDAIQFKKQGNGTYTNIIISGYTTVGATAVRIQDVPTNTDQVTGGKIKLLNVKIIDGTSQFGGVTASAVGVTPVVVGVTPVFDPLNYTLATGAGTGAVLTPGAWAVVNGVNLLSNL